MTRRDWIMLVIGAVIGVVGVFVTLSVAWQSFWAARGW